MVYSPMSITFPTTLATHLQNLRQPQVLELFGRETLSNPLGVQWPRLSNTELRHMNLIAAIDAGQFTTIKSETRSELVD